MEILQEVPEASIETQDLYDDTGLPLGDMASALYVNTDNGDKYEQLSRERTCRDHQYIDLESPEGSDYEDCEIVIRQQDATREHLLQTSVTTGIDARQTNYGDLDLTAMSHDLPETPIDAPQQYMDLEFPEGSDYEDCKIVTRQQGATREHLL